MSSDFHRLVCENLAIDDTPLEIIACNRTLPLPQEILESDQDSISSVGQSNVKTYALTRNGG